MFCIYNYAMVKLRLFCLLYCSLNLCIFYEPATTTTKLPLVGWLKFLNWIELNTVYFSVNCFPLYVKCGISGQARCMQNQLWRTAAEKPVQCVIQEQLSWQDAYSNARKPVWEVWTNGAKANLFKGECLLSGHETGCIQFHQKTSPWSCLKENTLKAWGRVWMSENQYERYELIQL